MFGYYQRPVFYRRTPSLFDEIFNLERSMRRQNEIERFLFPELFLPKLFYIIQAQEAKDEKETNKEESKTNNEANVNKSEKKEEQKEEKESKETEKEEIKKEEKIENETNNKEEEIKEDSVQHETEKETEPINKEQKEEEIKENNVEKEEEEPKQVEEKETEQKQEEENDEKEIPEHELDDDNYSIKTKMITKNDGKFKHIFKEEKGLTTGITKSIETRIIGDQSMSLTRISFPDGSIEEYEDRQNINNDEEFEKFKKEWISTFPIQTQPIEQETH